MATTTDDDWDSLLYSKGKFSHYYASGTIPSVIKVNEDILSQETFTRIFQKEINSFQNEPQSIDENQKNINWKPITDEINEIIQRTMGLPKSITYELNKINFYGPKNKLINNEQIQKKQQIGNLLLILPSQYEGGTITIKQNENSSENLLSAPKGDYCSFVAYFNDDKISFHCNPIETGFTVAISISILSKTKIQSKEISNDILQLQHLLEYFAISPVQNSSNMISFIGRNKYSYDIDHINQLNNNDFIAIQKLKFACELYNKSWNYFDTKASLCFFLRYFFRQGKFTDYHSLPIPILGDNNIENYSNNIIIDAKEMIGKTMIFTRSNNCK